MKTAILLMGHGSRIAGASSALDTIAAMVKETSGFDIVEVSFREKQAPNIQQGIDACVKQGAERIMLVPYFLYMGAHVLEDLPQEIEEAQLRYPGVQMAMGKPLGSHPKLAEIVSERIGEAFDENGWT